MENRLESAMFRALTNFQFHQACLVFSKKQKKQKRCAAEGPPVNFKPNFSCLTILLLATVSSLLAQVPAKHAMTIDDLLAMRRVGEPQISPDGRFVAYTVGDAEMDANRIARNIWVVSTTPGSQPRQLTQSGHDTRPQWSPDGKKIAFLSGRDGAGQIYLISAQGGNATKVTSLSGGADNEKWSPDGKTIAFTSSVFPECPDDACNRSRDDAAEKSKVKARVYDHLLYRHWTHWSDGKRSHLFLTAAGGGAPRDLTARAEYDVPPDERGDAARNARTHDHRADGTADYYRRQHRLHLYGGQLIRNRQRIARL